MFLNILACVLDLCPLQYLLVEQIEHLHYRSKTDNIFISCFSIFNNVLIYIKTSRASPYQISLHSIIILKIKQFIEHCGLPNQSLLPSFCKSFFKYLNFHYLCLFDM